MESFVLLALVIATAVAAQLLLKRAALDASGGALLRMLRSGWFIGGCACLGVQMIAWVRVLRALPLSIAHPITGVVFILAPVGSHLLWREPLPASRLLGIVVIIVGVVLVARGAG